MTQPNVNSEKQTRAEYFQSELPTWKKKISLVTFLTDHVALILLNFVFIEALF